MEENYQYCIVTLQGYRTLIVIVKELKFYDKLLFYAYKERHEVNDKQHIDVVILAILTPNGGWEITTEKEQMRLLDGTTFPKGFKYQTYPPLSPSQSNTIQKEKSSFFQKIWNWMRKFFAIN